MVARELTLVVGATGYLGTELVRQMIRNGLSVRAAVREGCDPGKLRTLTGLGAELVVADLKTPSTLQEACKGVRAVVSTASTTLSRQAGDSIEAVDRDGQLALIDAAEAAHVERFVFISFPPSSIRFALQSAKRAVEERLKGSSLAYTILQPTNFMEIWLQPMMGFNPAAKSVRLFGNGENPVSWISLHDVARFAVAAVVDKRFARRTLQLGGPDALTGANLIGLVESVVGDKVTAEYVQEDVLASQLSAASNSLEEAYAATGISTARGQVVDMSEAIGLLPGRLRSVREYTQQLLRG